MICAQCANRLASAYDFAMNVSESDKRFAGLLDESSTSKIIEYVDEVEFISNPEIIQIDDMAEIPNVDADEFDDNITVSDHDRDDGEDNSYVIKTATKRPINSEYTNYVSVPQYTITTQHQDVDMSDIFLSKDRTTPLIVKTVDVAAVHIASDNLDFNDSLLCKDYENDKDSMYMCKYCPKGMTITHFPDRGIQI